MQYFALLSCESVVLESRKGKLYMRSPDSDNETFELMIGKYKGDISVALFADNLKKVLKQASGESKLSLYLEPESAAALEQDGQYWFIVPVEE